MKEDDRLNFTPEGITVWVKSSRLDEETPKLQSRLGHLNKFLYAPLVNSNISTVFTFYYFRWLLKVHKRYEEGTLVSD